MKKLFITGAGGFVGSRLVEILKEKHETEISVLLRNVSKAARISRYQLNYFQGSITDETALDSAINGCDTMVHCAHDFNSDEANIKAADNIAKLCLKHKINRLVYISTSGVHLCGGKEIINENSALNHSWSYAINKHRVEEKLLDYYHKYNLPLVILRPSVIYGPFAGVWTNGFVRELMEFRVIIPFEGNRICNAVYIDDVVQAIINSMNAPGVKCGQIYLVSGADKVTWKEYVNGYKDYTGVQEPVFWDDEQSANWYEQLKRDPVTEVNPTLRQDPISYLKSGYTYKIYQRLLKNSFLKKKLLSAKSRIPRPLKYPSPESFETFGCTAKIDISKIVKELGFKPEFDLPIGIKKTKMYLNWFGLNTD